MGQDVYQSWLQVPSQKADGTLTFKFKSGKGMPQGGVISPLLSSVFLHYAFDKWLTKNYPNLVFVRYADDIIVHCNNEQEANEMLV